MNEPTRIIRNYHPADFDKYVRLNIEAKKLDPGGHRIITQVIAENLARPNYSPQQDLFLAEIAGSIIGYMDVTPELIIGRVTLDCWVHPKYRRRGLGTGLLDYAMRRARELGVKIAHVNIMEDNLVARRILSGLGFGCVRRFLELSLDMSEMRWQDIDQRECRHLRRGEEDKLVRIQNRAFIGTWGYNPNTLEELVYNTNLINRSSEDVILACDRDEVIGYCWTEIVSEAQANHGEKKGRILMIGTDPDCRGRGIGRRVLLAGLDHLRSRGVKVAEITVDNENKVACGLYYSVGFELLLGSLWYEKLLGSDVRKNQATGDK